MSIAVSGRVWALSTHGNTELLMLLALADFADDNGRCYPSVRTLAARCRITPRQANRLLAKLRDSGEVEISLSAGPGGANVYRVLATPSATHQAPDSSVTPDAHVTPLDVCATPPVAHVTPDVCDALTPATRPPDAHVLHPLTPVSDEPSLNRQEPPPTARNAVARRDPEGFAEFWACWPASSRKQDRKRCAAKWGRSGFATKLPEILAHVEAMKLTDTWCRGFEPAPLTYLNGERWGDGLPPPQPDTAATSPGTHRQRNALHADEQFT